VIEHWEAGVLFAMYIGYVITMKFNQTIYYKLTGKELYATEEGYKLMESDRQDSSRWPGTFRTGVLKVLSNPSSWLDTAGVGIVSKIAGQVDDVFTKVDKDGSGFLRKDELSELFEELICVFVYSFRRTHHRKS